MDNKNNLFQEFREKFDRKDFLRILEITYQSLKNKEFFDEVGDRLDLPKNTMQNLKDRLNNFMEKD